MFRFVVIALCLNTVYGGAIGYGGVLAGAGLAGYGGLARFGGYGGYGGLAGYGRGVALAGPAIGLARGYGLAQAGPLPAAIHSRRHYEVVPVPSHEEPAQLTQINVDPVENPVAIRFVSKSSPVLIDQVHIPGEPGQVTETNSEDEPHRVVHTVSRPVIQEVREIIQPYRSIQQEVRPVLEEISTVVARGEPRVNAVVAPAPAPVAVAAPVALAAPAPIAVAAPAPIAVAAPQAFALPAPGPLATLGNIGVAKTAFAFNSPIHSYGY